MTNVTWFDNDNVDAAIEAARSSAKPLLIDFWHPTCLGCAKMFATTYRDDAVQAFLRENFVCVKYNTTKPNDWYRRLNGHVAHVWHPHFMVADARLTEGRRIIGYLTPDTFIAQLQLGAGMLHMYHRRFADALAAFESAGGDTLPLNTIAESLYWQAVASYRLHGVDGLAPLWERLVRDFATTDWAQRGDCLDVEFPREGFDPTDTSTVRLRALAV
jgi:Thioredoxin-like